MLCDSKNSQEYTLNYIKTPYAEKIEQLLHNFDIPCCQIAFYNNVCYLTFECLYSLVTNKNIIKSIDPTKNSILIEYLYSNNSFTQSRKSTYDKIINSGHCENFIRSLTDYSEDYDINYQPENPILFNVNMSTKSFDLLQKYKKNMNCSYENKDLAKSIGCKFNYTNKSWYVPNNMSISKITNHINSQNNSDIRTVQKINEWNNNTLLITTKNPLDFWVMVCLFSNHRQKTRRLCNEIDYKNITIDDAMKILYLSGVQCDIIEDIEDGSLQDGKIGGWGHTLEETFILDEFVNDVLCNKNIRYCLQNKRYAERINKYKNRGFQFVFTA